MNSKKSCKLAAKTPWVPLHLLSSSIRALVIRKDGSRERYRVVVDSLGFWFLDTKNQQGVILDSLLMGSKWNVGRLCGMLGIGERTFARALERSVGIRPKEWLCKQRAVEAYRLLREIGKVEPVANMLGFNHVADFSREFRRQTKVIPSFHLKSELSRMFPATDIG